MNNRPRRGRGRGVKPKQYSEIQNGVHGYLSGQAPQNVSSRSGAQAISRSACIELNNASGGPINGQVSKIGPVQRPDEVEKVSSQLSSVSLKSLSKLASRPGFGIQGRPICLVTNFFPLKCNICDIFHYDVTVSSVDQIKKYGKQQNNKRPATANGDVSNKELQQINNVGRLLRKQVFAQLVNLKQLKKFNPIYDGEKNVFTTSPLPFDTQQIVNVELNLNGKMRKYQIIIQPVKKYDGTNRIDISVLQRMYSGGSEALNEVSMALNAIMNDRPLDSAHIQVGRSFFFLNQTKKVPIGEGIEIWFGYNQSIQFTQTGPAIVINVAVKAFYTPGPAIQTINEILRRDVTRGGPLKPYEMKKLDDSLGGLRVMVTHLRYPRKYTVKSISKVPAQNLKIKVNGQEITVAEYYNSKYKRLQYPFLHCFSMNSVNNQTYVPFELCVIGEGVPKLGVLNQALSSKMIKEAAKAPEERFRGIMKEANAVKMHCGEQMKKYNLFMDLKPMNVQGRVIDAPALAYSGEAVSQPNNKGVWYMNGQKFFKTSIEIKSWILLSFVEERDCPQQMLKNFVHIFSETGRDVGLQFGNFLGIRIHGKRDATEIILKKAQETGASFAVIVLSKKENSCIYDEIKFIADYNLGFVTQCIDKNVIQKFSGQIATNICLKVNAKLGGVNHILVKRPEIFAKPVIVFGADAVHSPRGSKCPSIASVVGSLDAYPSKYKLECRVQDNPDRTKISQELILELEEMVKSILKSFYHHTRGKYPEKIIYFRDGVSEGQFELVHEREVLQIQKACQDVVGGVLPITFIVVQKRHQYRFRPQNPRDGIGRGGNVPPGTTVDSDVTHPLQFDYFLCSHEGIQGTSKPAHYTILHDDNNFSADELQKLCYHMCHMYVRCNRSISIPAPVMYADLAAFRAKKYADLHIQKERNKGSSSSSSSDCLLPDYARNAINNMGKIKNNMFYV